MKHVAIKRKRRGTAKTLKSARRMALPAGWGKTVKVWAFSGNPIRWELESSLKDPATGYLVFNKKNDKMPKQDYYIIDFSLQDHTGLNLSFKPNPMKAFAVKIWGANPPPAPPYCPPQGSYADSIYAICCDQNGQSLSIRNDDMNTEYFSFALFFDSDAGDQCCDPGGVNQDGNYIYEY
jgi:hypothetical protein